MTDALDISSEEYRTYSYPDGSEFTIREPARLHVIQREGTTHRVVDQHGVVHRPERGWVGISWKPRPGAPEFVA